MKDKKTKENEYIVIANLIIFFVVTSFVVTTRLFFVLKNQDTSPAVSVEESMYLNYDKTIDFKATNLKLVKAIKNVYGIDIYYGVESKNLTASVSAITIQNEEEIFNMLNSLIKALSSFQAPFLREISSKGYKLDIFLVDYFTNGNIALANRNSNNEFKIYISNTNQIEREVYHETYHIIEYCIKLQEGASIKYASWDALNPKDFEYTNNINALDTKYVYNYEKIENSYFLTIYSKFSAKEDRAEIFAESMLLKSIPSYFAEETKIKDKANFMNNIIKEYFNSIKLENNKAEWEKYI